MKSSFTNMVLSLTIITVVAGAALGLVNGFTQGAIAESDQLKKKAAIENVVLPFDNNPVEQQYDVTLDDGTTATVFPVTKEGQQVGAAVEYVGNTGFGGPIKVIVGFEADGTIHDYRVMEHKETPGLGAKMDEWFRTETASAAAAGEEKSSAWLFADKWLFRAGGAAKQQSVLTKNPGRDNLTVSKDGGDIDGITAATISSRAFLHIINNAYKAYMSKNTNGESGATPSDSAQSKEEVR